MRKLIIWGVFMGCIIASMAFIHPKKVKPAPNIIVILADDLGYGDLRCYNPQSQVNSQNLDKLAQNGLIFKDAHSGSSVCTPTRYGLLTGRYAFRSPLKKGVLGGYSPALIEPERFTLANLLKNGGYHTGIVGKWHLGLNWPVRDANAVQKVKSPDVWPSGAGLDISADLISGPNQLGFDYSYIIPSSLDIPPYLYLENGSPINRQLIDLAGRNNPRGVFWRPGKANQGFEIEQTLDHLTDKAIAFLEQSRTRQEPFFLYFPLTSPHTPWVPAKKYEGQTGAGLFGDFVLHTDAVVGRVMDALKKLQLDENTIVIFTSDNGADWKPADKVAYPKHQANGILKGQKSDIWEGGHRVPFIVSWPAQIKKKAQVDQLVCLTDLMATFAGLTSQKLPQSAGQDSFDFSPWLLNQKPTKAARTSVIHHSIDGVFAIRKGKWKFIDGKGSGGWSIDSSATRDLSTQLFDLENDLAESNNVVLKYPKIAQELKALLVQHQQTGFSRKGSKE